MSNTDNSDYCLSQTKFLIKLVYVYFLYILPVISNKQKKNWSLSVCDNESPLYSN